MDWSAAALSALARATIASLCGAGGVDVEGDVKGDVAPRTACSVCVEGDGAGVSGAEASSCNRLGRRQCIIRR